MKLSVKPARTMFPGLLFTCHAVEFCFANTIKPPVVLFFNRMFPFQFGALLNKMDTVKPGAPPVVAPS